MFFFLIINFHSTASGLMAMADYLYIVVPGFFLKYPTSQEVVCSVRFMDHNTFLHFNPPSIHAHNSCHLLDLKNHPNSLTLVSSTLFLRCQNFKYLGPFERMILPPSSYSHCYFRML